MICGRAYLSFLTSYLDHRTSPCPRFERYYVVVVVACSWRVFDNLRWCKEESEKGGLRAGRGCGVEKLVLFTTEQQAKDDNK